MTSSLVGSEMCIRDRGKQSEKRGNKDKRISARNFRREKSGREFLAGNFPVSYTHLTLPTICSV
eukprot:10612358-Prorocentrum_lima.AAC.1